MDDVGDVLYIEDWNQTHWGKFEKNQVMFFTAIAVKNVAQSKYVLNNYSPVIAVDPNNNHKAPKATGINWSEISYEEEFEKAKDITINEAIMKKNLAAGTFDNNTYYKLKYCQIKNISHIFKIVDEDGKRLLESLNEKYVLDEVTGNERPVNRNKDVVSYALNLTLKDPKTDQVLYCNGWELCGKSIFNVPANDLYYHYTSEQLQTALRQVTDFEFNFLLKIWSRQNKTGWTVEKVFEIIDYNENSEGNNDANNEYPIKIEKTIDLTK